MKQLIALTPLFFVTASFFGGVAFCIGQCILKSTASRNQTLHVLLFGALALLNLAFGAVVVIDYLTG